MSTEFGPLTASLARRILEIAPYAERLRVGRLVPPLGLTSSHVRSLRELHLHLEPDPRSLPGIDVAAAAAWIERVLGDGELAGRIRTLAAEAAPYVDTCRKLRDLVGTRLSQAGDALGPEAER